MTYKRFANLKTAQAEATRLAHTDTTRVFAPHYDGVSYCVACYDRATTNMVGLVAKDDVDFDEESERNADASYERDEVAGDA